jgi:hypothetical protein
VVVMLGGHGRKTMLLMRMVIESDSNPKVDQSQFDVWKQELPNEVETSTHSHPMQPRCQNQMMEQMMKNVGKSEMPHELGWIDSKYCQWLMTEYFAQKKMLGAAEVEAVGKRT